MGNLRTEMKNEKATQSELDEIGLVVQSYAWRLAISPETKLYHFWKNSGGRRWRSRESFLSRQPAREAQLAGHLHWELVADSLGAGASHQLG